MNRDDFDALEEFDPLREETMRLPRGIQPERDLWPGVEARIRALGDVPATGPASGKVIRGDFARGARVMLAAAAVVVVFVVGLATGLLRRDGGRSVADAPAGAPVAVTPFDAIDAGHASESRDVLEALARVEDLDPATVELIRRNLEIIETAIAEIQAALADDPGNPGLNRLLTSEYQRRGDVLRRAARLADSI
jgi:hypothetical protein